MKITQAITVGRSVGRTFRKEKKVKFVRADELLAQTLLMYIPSKWSQLFSIEVNVNLFYVNGIWNVFVFFIFFIFRNSGSARNIKLNPEYFNICCQKFKYWEWKCYHLPFLKNCTIDIILKNTWVYHNESYNTSFFQLFLQTAPGSSPWTCQYCSTDLLSNFSQLSLIDYKLLYSELLAFRNPF